MSNSKPGVAAFHANIEKMKQVGKDNERLRAQEAERNTKAHLDTMAARAAEAAAAAEKRRLDGIARRNAHNAMLAEQKRQREARRNAVKTQSSRAA